MIDFNQYFKGLKKTIEGKDNYYFLVNDTNNEIRQHYDYDYQSSIDIQRFAKSIASKKDYFYSKNINYEFFVIPDKSITARQYLPFETPEPKRITNQLGGLVHDLRSIITIDDVLRNDTHISVMSSLKVTPHILSVLHGTEAKDYTQRITDKTHVEVVDHKGDLFFVFNWSYPQDERFKNYAHMQLETLELNDEYKQVELEDIPEEYRRVSKRKSEYYINPNSISNKKALVLRDSSTNSLTKSFIAYYREVFFYWDHWYFNKQLVEWFNPDDVIEIRTERFIENPHYPTSETDFKIKQDVILNLETFESHDKKLKVKFDIMDYYNRPIDTKVDIYINDEPFVSDDTSNSIFDKCYDLSSYPTNRYNLKVIVNATDTTNQFKFTRSILISEDIRKYFTNLKSSIKGLNDTFFLVNDNTNELLQHYDLEYDSSLDLRQFKQSLESKRKYLAKKNIKFTQFIIPDKSVVLREYLPFETTDAKRNWDSLKNYYYDLSDVIGTDDFLVNDTKLTSQAAVKAVSYILFKTFKKKSFSEIKSEILEKFTTNQVTHQGDLFTDDAWSYPKDDVYEKYSRIDIDELSLIAKDKLTHKEIDEEFLQFNNVASDYIHNPDSISDKKALIICDKSAHPLFEAFIAYFREVFFYHDFWYFNKNLIDYASFDVVIEVKAERFLDTALTFIINDNSRVLIPVKINVNQFERADNKLTVDVSCRDIRNLPVYSTLKFYIDDELLCERELMQGRCICSLNVEDLNVGSHILKIRLEESESTKARVITKEFDIN
ncbi:MAG: hypothetical protein IJJ11_02200 [Methanosphaera sp.]|nr:hypothetical protein [Methanosphaera sp.]